MADEFDCSADEYTTETDPEPIRAWYINNVCNVKYDLTNLSTQIKEYNDFVEDYTKRALHVNAAMAKGASGLKPIKGIDAFPDEPVKSMQAIAASEAALNLDGSSSVDVKRLEELDDTMTDGFNEDYEELWQGLLEPGMGSDLPEAASDLSDKDYNFLERLTVISILVQNIIIANKEFDQALVDAGAEELLGSDDAALAQGAQDILDGVESEEAAAAQGAIDERVADAKESGEWVRGDDAYSNMVFKEQCYLLAKIFELVEYKRDKIDYGFVPNQLGPRYRKKLPYYPEAWPDGTNACLAINGEPYGFINQLVQSKAQRAFFNMSTEQISSLQPMIRLFKIEDIDGEEFQREFNFDAYASKSDVESLFTNKNKRGFGVGIKNFSFTYDGNSPFAAKKSIKAKLTIFASSFDELLKDRGDYTYADLALKTGKGKTSKDDDSDNSAACQQLKEIREDNLSKLNFRLKAVVGFARPSGNTSGIFPPSTTTQQNDLLDAIAESSITLNLTPTIHEFKFDEAGRVTFTCNYLAYIDDFFDQPHFDIFFNEGVAKRVKGRRYAYESATKNCSAEEIGKYKEELTKTGVVRKDKFINLRSLMRKLFFTKKIRTLNMDFNDVLTFQSQGPFQETAGSIQELLDAANVNNSAALEAALSQSNLQGPAEDSDDDAASSKPLKLGENVNFFYVSDLLDLILENIEERLRLFSNAQTWEEVNSPGLALFAASVTHKIATTADSGAGDVSSGLSSQLGRTMATEMWMADMSADEIQREIKQHAEFHREFKKFRLLLGPVEIVDPKNNIQATNVNFGDIPISSRYFMEWLSAKMLKTEQSRYGLSSFLNAFFNDLLKNFLNNDSCFSGFSTKQKTHLSSAAITSYKDSDQPLDEITQYAKNGVDPENSGHERMPDTKKMTQPILNVSGPAGLPVSDTGVENEMHYMIFFAGRTQPENLMNGSREEDEDRGIFHYLLGRPRGIIKNITLSRTQAKYLKEVRFEQEGFDGLEQLREVYDVDIDCYANVKTFPGTYIYVDPRGFAPNQISYDGQPLDLTMFGIGGYCMIIRSEHTFGPGQAQTKLTAKWVAQLSHEEEEAACKAKKATTSGDGSATKCGAPDPPPTPPADPTSADTGGTITGGFSGG